MTDKFYVTHNDGNETFFKPSIIGDTIITETGLDEELARRIQNRIARKIYDMKKDGIDHISTGAIRALVSSHLLKENLIEAEEKKSCAWNDSYRI